MCFLIVFCCYCCFFMVILIWANWNVCLLLIESDIDRDSSRLRSNRHIGPDRKSRAWLQLTRQRTASLERHVGESETTHCPMAQSKRPRRWQAYLKTFRYFHLNDLSSSSSSSFFNSICFHSSLLILTCLLYFFNCFNSSISILFFHSQLKIYIYIYNHKPDMIH